MKIKKVILLSTVITFLFTACTKKEINQNNTTETPDTTSIQETWTNEDLEKYLISAERWEIDNSGTMDVYSINELHDFFSGNDNKGIFDFGIWTVIAPNAVEIVFQSGKIEKIVYTEITENSFKWNDHTAKAINQNLDETTRSHIPLFSKLDLSAIVESGSITETYFQFSSPKKMIVNTGDGSSLNYRKEPVTGEKIGKFSDGDSVYVSQRTYTESTIDGITDYWYYALSYADFEPYGGWVFGGYLFDPMASTSSNSLFSELLGKWDSDRYILTLEADGYFSLGLKESEGLSGDWTLENGKTIKVKNVQIYDEEPTSLEMEVISVSEDELSVLWNDSTIAFTKIYEDGL